jgi:hypothetical protein
MVAVWYATREDVKRATDTRETARNNQQVDRAIASATDSIETDQLHRVFYPEVAARAFDWPSHVDREDGARTVALGRDELIACTEIRVAGVLVDPAHYTLLAAGQSGDGPYTAVELDATVTLPDGVAGRRAVEITGVYGYWDREDPAGALAAAVADTITTAVTDSAAVGVGHLLKVGAERMIVSGRSMVDTGQNLAGNVTSTESARVVPVGSGAAFVEGEVVMVDAEKMLITEIAGNTLIVKRAWDGSALAEHATGADVYAPRRLAVARGALGTIAATHAQGAAVTTHRIPDLVRQLCIGEALVAVAQENTGYGRKVGSGDAERDAAGAGLEDLRTRAYAAHGRRRF